MRSKLRKEGKDVVIDHKVELDLLRTTVEGLDPEQRTAEIEKLEQSYGPLGNRPGNRQIIGAQQNELKRQQSKQVQRALQAMQNRTGLQRAAMRLGFTSEQLVGLQEQLINQRQALPAPRIMLVD